MLVQYKSRYLEKVVKLIGYYNNTRKKVILRDGDRVWIAPINYTTPNLCQKKTYKKP